METRELIEWLRELYDLCTLHSPKAPLVGQGDNIRARNKIIKRLRECDAREQLINSIDEMINCFEATK